MSCPGGRIPEVSLALPRFTGSVYPAFSLVLYRRPWLHCQPNALSLNINGIGYLSSTGTDTAENVAASNNNTGTVVIGGGTASFTIAPSAATLSIAQGASGTDAITVTDVNGFSGTVTYVASGLPSGVTAAFNGNTLTLTASASATAGNSNITITGTSGSTTATTTIALTVSTTSGGAGGCTMDYTISPQNTSAFGAAITLVNNSTTAWTSWKLTWTFANSQTISSLWNGNETQSGAAVTVTNESYNGSIAAGATLTGIGFNGTWNGTTNAVPTSISLNGIACMVN